LAAGAGQEREEALELLSEAYQIASAVLAKMIGQPATTPSAAPDVSLSCRAR